MLFYSIFRCYIQLTIVSLYFDDLNEFFSHQTSLNHMLLIILIRVYLLDWKTARLRCSSANYYEIQFSAINFSSSIVVIDKSDTRVQNLHFASVFFILVFKDKISILSKFPTKKEKTIKFPCMHIQTVANVRSRK